MSRARDLANSADNDISGTLTVDDITLSGNITVGGTVDGRDLATDGSKLDGVEAGADVTDVTNVTAAGALMESAVTNLAQVKAFDSSDYATAAQGATADAALPKSGGTMTGSVSFAAGQTFDGRDLSVDGSKLDGIETGATADQTKADIDALNINADTLDGQHGSYYTTYADTAVSNLVNSAPTTLDTLNELAAALGDDPNFATTVTASIGTKLNSSDYTAADVLTKIKTVDGSGSGLDADTVDGIQGSSFLRSDTADTTTGTLTISTSGNNETLVLQANVSPYVRFKEGSTNRGYIQYDAVNNNMRIQNQEDGSGIRLRDDIEFTPNDGSNWYNIWHAGNDGSGSGLDADLLDGVQGSSFLRSDTADTASGDITFSGGAGAITISGGSDIRSGTGTNSWTGEQHGKMQYHNDNWYIQYQNGFNIRNSTGNNRVYVDSSGNLTAQGNVTAYSDIKLKKDIVTIENALDKINAMRGVYYTEIETDRARTGVIAQEIEKVLPEVVLDIEDHNPETGEKDTTKAVDYGNMVGLLIEAIKELKAEIEELKNGSTN